MNASTKLGLSPRMLALLAACGATNTGQGGDLFSTSNAYSGETAGAEEVSHGEFCRAVAGELKVVSDASIWSWQAFG